jgi:asparagine synthase (glutamine-hydrolysing)
VTVALGGDGGDEGFAGYDWYRTASRLQRLGQMIPVRAAALTGRALGHVGAGGTALAARAARLGRGLSVIGSGSRAAQFSALRVFISDRDADSLYAGTLAEHRRAHGPVDRNQLAELYEACDGSDLRRMRYADVRTYLADCLMPKVDVATMAHGLEARAPLLDQEVLEFAFSLPDEFVADEDTTKKPLRRLLARYVPPALFERRKQGFTPPLSTWFSGALSASVGSLATSDALMATGWFSSRGIARMLADHVAGERDNSQRLFQLVVLDAWLRQR